MQNPRPRTTSSTSHSYSQFHPRQLLRSKTAEERATGTPRLPLRPQTPSNRQTYNDTSGGVREGPWQHMAQTYAWVVEQEFVRCQKDTKHGERWVLKQPIFVPDDNKNRVVSRRERKGSVMMKEWDEMVNGYWEEGARWMRQEEEARRVAVEREREKTRLVQEEMKRIEDRIWQKRNQEKKRLAEERMRAYEEVKERERRADRVLVDAWRGYESRWAVLTSSSSSEPITFNTLPWPTTSPPTSPTSIKPAEIVQFLFSPLHSQGQSRKERIRSALLRWHPDRFRRVLHRVKEEDRAAVDEGVGIVARCLNDLMARETKLFAYKSLQ